MMTAEQVLAAVSAHGITLVFSRGDLRGLDEGAPWDCEWGAYLGYRLIAWDPPTEYEVAAYGVSAEEAVTKLMEIIECRPSQKTTPP